MNSLLKPLGNETNKILNTLRLGCVTTNLIENGFFLWNEILIQQCNIKNCVSMFMAHKLNS